MACRKGELREEEKNRNTAAAAPSSGIGDALLLATMCMIGVPVDVYARDGSAYSGIFHTANIEKDYDVILKKARMIQKGSFEGNVMDGALIETLIIRSQDLVQIIAKGVQFPSDGITGCAGDDDIEASVGCSRSSDNDAEVIHTNRINGNKKHKSHTSSTAEAANQMSSSSEEHNERLGTMKYVKVEVHDVSVDGRNAEDSSIEIVSNSSRKPEFQDQRIINEAQGTSRTSKSGKDPSIPVNLEHTLQHERRGASSVSSNTGEEPSQRRLTSDEVACSVASPPSISVVSTPMIGAKSESCLRASSNPFLFVPPRSSNVNKTAKKESKLNPGAKIFSPSTLPRSSVRPAVPNGASVSYMPGTYPVATPQEIDASSFAHPSVPVKLTQYNSVTVGHGGNEAVYVQQPIVGQVVNRMLPARYTSQYHNFQEGPTYAHPNSQNVMLGCMGPLVCMHPIPNDIVQSPAGFSPAATQPLFAKHQGNASAQALPLCMSPPIMANGLQQFVMPTPVPISQPLVPVLQPVSIPGLNGFLNAKYT